jgi:hypothetical protein
MKKLLAFSALALVTVAIAAGPNLKLTPGTIGNGATAKWVSQPASGGRANHVLLLSKNVPTTEFEAAGADIGRISGNDAGDLTLLAWTVVGGTIEGGSPRWNIYLDHNHNGVFDAGDVVVFLDRNSPGGADDSFDQTEIQTAVTAAGGDLDDPILYLQIIVDVQHSVQLDDIKVGLNGSTTTFSGPGSSN